MKEHVVQSTGIFRNTSIQSQPEGKSTGNLNIVFDTENTVLKREPGMSNHTSGLGYTIGRVQGDNCFFLFTKNDTEDAIWYTSVVDGVETCTKIANGSLGFRYDKPITGVTRTINGCETIVYWCDGFNPDRFFNVLHPERFKTSGVFDKDKMDIINLVKPFPVNCIAGDGGILSEGKYFVVAEVLDKGLVTIGRSFVSPPCLAIDDKRPIEFAKNFSILAQASELDSKGSYISFVLIGYNSVDGGSIQAYRSQPIPYNGNACSYTFIGNEAFADWRTATQYFYPEQTSRAMSECYGGLVRGGMTMKQYDYWDMQLKACDAEVTWVASNSDWGLCPMEVYGVGVAFVYPDGYVSPFMHVPGYDQDVYADESILVHYNDEDMMIGYDSNEAQTESITVKASGNFIPGINIFRVTVDVYNSQNSLITGNIYTSVEFLTENEATYNGHLEVNHSTVSSPGSTVISGKVLYNGNYFTFAGTVNTTNTVFTMNVSYMGIGSLVDRYKVVDTAFNRTATTGVCGFYEMSNETYQNPTNWCNETNYWPESLHGQKVRHHKMPGRKLVPFGNSIGLKVDVPVLPNGAIGYIVGISNKSPMQETVCWGGTAYNGESGDADNHGFSANGTLYSHTEGASGNYHRVITQEHLVKDKWRNYKFFYKTHYLDDINISTDSDNEPNFFDYKSSLYEALKVYVRSCSINIIDDVDELFTISNSVYMPASSKIEGTIDLTNQSYSHNFTMIDIGVENQVNYYGAFINLLPPVGNINSISYEVITNGLYTDTTILFPRKHWQGRVPLFNIYDMFLGYGSTFQRVVCSFFRATSILARLVMPSLGSASIRVFSEFISNYPLEGKFMFEARKNLLVGDGRICNSPESALQLTKEKVSIKNGDKYQLSEEHRPEVYDINPNLYNNNPLQALPGMDNAYDYCNQCNGKNLNRFVWSAFSGEEENIDSWRYYKPLDYKDVPASLGMINGIDSFGGKLIIRCSEHAYVQPFSMSTVLVEEEVYIGSGKAFAQDGMVMQSAGQTFRTASIKCDGGLFWMNSKRAFVFRWDGQLNEYGSRLIGGWLDSAVKDSWITTNGGGEFASVIFGYDPIFKRVLITNHKNSNNTLAIDKEGRTRINNIVVPASNFFNAWSENGWTISLSIPYNEWASYHTYFPSAYAYLPGTDSSFATPFQLTASLWKYGTRDGSLFHSYFGVNSRCYIEFVVTNLIDLELSCISYTTDSQMTDTQPFNELLVLSDRHNTGYLSIEYQLSNDRPSQVWDNVTKFAKRAGNTFRINTIRNLASVVDNIQQTSFNIEPLLSAIDNNLSQYQQSKIQGKYLLIRVGCDNTMVTTRGNLERLIATYYERRTRY